MFKIASFNVNSIRARLEIVLEWIQREKPDVFCLQETKVEDKDFPVSAFHDLGFNVFFKGRKSYNGVALISPHDMEELDHGVMDFMDPGEARLVAAKVQGIYVFNTYVPQGQSTASEQFAYKLRWIRGMRRIFEQWYAPEMPLVWAGDLNVAPEAMDVHDPKRLYGQVGYHPEEHSALQFVKEWGFVDVFREHVKEGGHYSFWDYRIPRLVQYNKGWRIDHIWATRFLASKSRHAWIDRELRLKPKPSDHAPVVAEFDWEQDEKD